MTIRKTLTSIVLAGALALSAAGCGRNYSQYKYDGKIGKDKVTFTETRHTLNWDNNILTVIKPDGRVIQYVDTVADDLKLEYVKITKNDQTTKYTASDEVGKPILEEAQKQFDNYMKQIKETRTNQGLENLK